MITQLTLNYICSILIFTYLYLIGSTLLEKLDLQFDVYTNTFLSLTSGIFISINFLIVISLFNSLEKYTVISALAISSLLLIKKIKKYKLIKINPSLTLIILIFLFFSAFASIKYPGHWDDTMYHLPIARWYLENQSLTLNPYLRFPLFPQNMNVFIAGGLALGDVFFAQFLCTLPLAVIAIGLISISKRYTNSIFLGIISFACLIGAKPFASTIGYAYIDFGLSLFCFAAVICLSLFNENEHSQSKNIRIIFLSGFFSGAAIGTKLFGLAFCAACFVYLIFFIKEKKYIFAWILSITIFGSFWYIRSLLISGDPINPAGGDIFGHFIWNKGDLALQKMEQGSHGVDPKSFDFIGALRSAGVFFIGLSVSLLFFYKKLNKQISLFLFITVSYLFFWFFVTQVDRYLSPILPLAFFLSFYLLHFVFSTISKQTNYAQYIAAAAAVILISANYQQYLTIFNPELYRVTYLKSRPGYEIFQKANENIDHLGPNLVHMGFENSIYFYNGIAIGDWFGIGRYREMANCNVPHCEPYDENVVSEIMKSKFHAGQLAISKERSPLFNPKIFENNFNLIFEDNFGYLFILRKK